jgi:cell division protein FtsI (penicillin-binding protein 3)
LQVHVTHNRIALIAFALLAGLGLACFRLAQLQLIQHGDLQAKARAQQLHATALPARRGSILDRHGVVLAESVVTESVFVNAHLARGKGFLPAKLAGALGVSARWMDLRIRKGKSFWAKRGARLEQTASLKALHLDCLTFDAESKRVYPQGRLACHVLGFTNVDGHGIEGIERQYDSVLAGKAGLMEAARDAHGKDLPADHELRRAAQNGSDLVLTLDGQLQEMAERELAKACRKYRPNWGGMVVMDPATGEILALANLPDYDPNEPSRFSQSDRRDRAVADAFEPGSTFKVITATLALEKGVVKPDTLVNCQGGKGEFLGRTVHDHGDDHMGVVPFSEVIAQSSNVGTVTVAQKLTKQEMYDGVRRFGYGRKTGIDLPGEARGLLRPLENWSGISMAAVPYGQEVQGNLVHVACTYAPVANGGRTVAPHLGAEIRGSGFSRRPSLPADAQSGSKVISEGVRRQLIGMLEQVVDHGTGTPAALPGFLVAGKTGTAQKVDPRTHRYSDRTVSSFVGFVPADHPRLLMAIVLDEPRGLQLGGWVAGPVFHDAALGMLAALDVQPDAALLAGKGAQAGIAHLPGKEPKWKQKPLVAPEPMEAEVVTVPVLKGLDDRGAQKVLAEARLKGVSRGRLGLVTSQFPPAGQHVRAFTSVSYLLKPPQWKQDGDKTSGSKDQKVSARIQPAQKEGGKKTVLTIRSLF